MQKKRAVMWGLVGVLVLVILWLMTRHHAASSVVNKRGDVAYGDINFGDIFLTQTIDGNFTMPDILLYLNLFSTSPAVFNIGGLSFGGSGVACSSCNVENTRRLFPWIEDTFNSLVSFYDERERRGLDAPREIAPVPFAPTN